MGKIPPFEFMNYLSSLYNDCCDLLFYKDIHQCWYHKGIEGISTSIKETADYLERKINRQPEKQYEKVIFMGTSAGGYAAILFGSLCKANYVISFKPQTILNNAINKEYSNLKNIINPDTNYLVFASNCDIGLHDIYHCKNIQEWKNNVKVIAKKNINLKEMRDKGVIKKIIDEIIHN